MRWIICKSFQKLQKLIPGTQQREDIVMGNALLIVFVSCSNGDLFYCCLPGQAWWVGPGPPVSGCSPGRPKQRLGIYLVHMQGVLTSQLQYYKTNRPWKKHTANEGPVRIQYKCLVPIYVFPEMKLHGRAISKTELYVLSHNFHIHVSACDLYIPRTNLPILLKPNRQTDPGII
jgi:hypothetical protein